MVILDALRVITFGNQDDDGFVNSFWHDPTLEKTYHSFGNLLF